MTAPVSASRSSKAWSALHGGEIAIRSRVGEGTRITVRLPIDCEQARGPDDTMTIMPRPPIAAGPATREVATAVKKSA